MKKKLLLLFQVTFSFFSTYFIIILISFPFFSFFFLLRSSLGSKYFISKITRGMHTPFLSSILYSLSFFVLYMQSSFKKEKKFQSSVFPFSINWYVDSTILSLIILIILIPDMWYIVLDYLPSHSLSSSILNLILLVENTYPDSKRTLSLSQGGNDVFILKYVTPDWKDDWMTSDLMSGPAQPDQMSSGAEELKMKQEANSQVWGRKMRILYILILTISYIIRMMCVCLFQF